MRAYNLPFGSDLDHLYISPSPNEKDTVVAPISPVKAGWYGGEPPAFNSTEWPRSAITGYPTLHVLTLELSEDYRVRGNEYPAISFFSGEGQFAGGNAAIPLGGRVATPEELSSPFPADVAAHAAAATEGR